MANEEQINGILQLSCKKHVKIYKLHQLEIPKKEIAKLLATNSGAVSNALKDYDNNPDKVAKANEISVATSIASE